MVKPPDSVWVSWMNGTEDVSHAVEHALANYGGLVPSIGDRIVTDWPDGWDTFEVVERYLVQGQGEHVRWHIVLQPIDLPPRRDYALHLNDEAKKLQQRIVAERHKVSLESTLAMQKAINKRDFAED